MNSKINSSLEARLIFLLVRDYISEADQLIKKSSINYKKVLNIAHSHKVLPLICKKLLHLPNNSELSSEIKDDANKILLKAAAIHSHMRHELHVFSDLCSKNNIDFLLIKGFAVDKSPLRQMNDIDVLIHKKDLDKVFTLLKSNGYTYVGSNILSEKELKNPEIQYNWNNQFQFRVPNSKLTVEVHTNLF